MTPAFALLSLFPVLVLTAALSDVATLKIPNWLCGLTALAFFPAALVAGTDLSTIAVHAGVGFAALLIGVGLFAAGWLGGGDAKLVAAAALWFGWPDAGAFLMWTVLAGGVLALTLLIGRRYAPAMPAAPGWAVRLLSPGGAVPYGAAIAAGALIAFPSSALMRAAGSLG